MKKKPKLTILSGAGMSAESGLSTFRDADGLWAKYRIEEVCTPEALQKNPQLVQDFYNMRRREALEAEPCEGHRIIASLEQDFEVVVVTQNVDKLHERAGSSRVIHLHGEIDKCASIRDPYIPLPLPEGRVDLTVEDVDEHGHMLRPFIVFFGEQVPRLEEGIRAVQEADLFLIIGTSLNVYPASGLVHYTKPGCDIYLIDPNEVPTSVPVRQIRKGASEGMKELAQEIRRLYAHE